MLTIQDIHTFAGIRLPTTSREVIGEKFMHALLLKIKRLIIAKRYRFTLKTEAEMFADALAEPDVLEARLNANGIKKTIRSNNPQTGKREKLHV